MTLLFIPLLPLAAVLLSLLPLGRRFAPGVTLAAAAAALTLSVQLALRVASTHLVVGIPRWVELDGLSALLLLAVAIVCTTAALFSWGYIEAHHLPPARIRSYYAHFNLFVFSLVLVPVLAEPALVWIAIEFTAVFSVLLVAFDNTHAALEAAWKYIALMFMGAAIALLGFFLLFWAQQQAGGGHYSWQGLREVAAQLPPVLVGAAFVLILVGFGVKAGLVPMHTWLPDAHSQAPSPVCALLSAVKTTNALYVILRLAQLLPPHRFGLAMQIFGLLSVGVAAFLLLQVRDYKRLFAYSTVEHMGIIFVAASLGPPGGTSAAILQLLTHSVTKSFCFLAAGAVLLVTGTRDIGSVRGLIRTSPVAGVALMTGGLAIAGAPPFGVFLSEFSILRAGLQQGDFIVTALLAAFIVVAFFGIMRPVNEMVFGRPEDAATASGRLPMTCRLALLLAAFPVLGLGLYQPGWLHTLLQLAAALLSPVGAS